MKLFNVCANKLSLSLSLQIAAGRNFEPRWQRLLSCRHCKTAGTPIFTQYFAFTSVYLRVGNFIG